MKIGFRAFDLVALGVTGLVSANVSNVDFGKEVESSVISVSSEKEEDEGSCSWCVYAGGSMHCAEVATCTDARKIAHQMAIDAME